MASETSQEALVAEARSFFRAGVKRVQAPRLLEATDSSSWAPQSLDAYDTLRVVGMGKAAMAMAGVVETQLGNRVEEGAVIVPEGYPDTYPDDMPRPSAVEVIEGGHPLPTQGSERGGRRIVEQVRSAKAEDLVLVLVSGGGTALATLPVDSLELNALRFTYQRLMERGVAIHDANVVRKHLTKIGGGQLAREAHPAHVGALVVSDVVGDDLSVIASGPTVPDPSTYEEAVRILYGNDLWRTVPAPIRDHLASGARGRRPETPTADDPCFEHATTTLVGTNRLALEAIREKAEQKGYEVRSVAVGVEGEAHEVGRAHGQTMRSAGSSRPTCWLWGGETTVTVTGSGRGGRNQEVALGGALTMEEMNEPAVLLSGGTDGIDGPTDAAGAWATPATAEKARRAGHDPEAHLDENDAYPLFDAIDQLLRTGPTHTNVMDLHIGLVAPE